MTERAYMAAVYGRGRVIQQQCVGEVVTLDGRHWQMWQSCSNDLYSIVRLKPVGDNPARRCRFVYDPSSHWRRSQAGFTNQKTEEGN